MPLVNTAILRSKGRTLALPASLEVQLDHSVGNVTQTLELLQIFRMLPSKRLVALARWQDALVVAKLFFTRGRWEQNMQREFQGITTMREAGIKTAELLGSGKFADGEGGFLLMRYIDGGTNLGDAWTQTASSARAPLLQRVVSLIADCHERGFVQRDIHLDNFLLKDDALYLLDAGDLERYPQHADGVDSVSALRNLALFLAQFPVCNDALVPELYDYYREQRPAADFSEDIAVFFALIRKKRSARLKVVLKKLYRATSATAFRRDWNHYIVYERSLESEALQAFLEQPDRYIDNGKIIKAGTTTTVALVDIGGAQYVLKRYNIKSLWHRIRRLFRPSRAWICWRNAHMLEMLGIATAKPLLMMEWRFGSLRREAYFLCEYLPGEDALHFLKKEPINTPAWEATLQQFKSIFATMRDYGIVHSDMKATNFIVSPDGLAVIDLDAMYQEFDTRRYARAHNKDLRRFMRNWEDDPAKAQQMQIMLGQLQEESDYFTKGS